MLAALGLQRATSLQANIVPTVNEILRMATVGGAKLLDMSDQIGSLTPGKKADLIVIDPVAVNFAPKFEGIPQIVFNTQTQNVEWVFVYASVFTSQVKWVGGNLYDIMRAY